MPVMSSTCRGGPRPTGWTRSGCARSLSGRCCGPASCRHRRSGGCGTWPATGLTWWRCAPPKSSGSSRLPGGRPDQTVGGGQRHLRGLGPTDAGRADRGRARPKLLAQLARGRMRAKRSVLAEAFCGFFTDHHGFLLAKMLARVDALDADIAELDRKLEELIVPFGQAVDRLDEICGVGRTAAQLILAEIGTDMGRFPTAGHLASWAKFTPGVKESAGKTKGKSSTGHGNRYLARVLGGPPWPPARPTPSWESATGASRDGAAPSGPSSRWAAPSW